jgi:3-hydroxymyristoyl/3-hydroxydecanoyl-(acyl carrier protein) dehydratase
MQEYQTDFTVAASHPALPGHFPGNPLVPGVVILDAVIRAAGQWQPGCRVRRVSSAKFVSPLLPQQPLRITLRAGGEGVAGFDCRVAERLVAQGKLELAREGDEPGLV